MYVTFQSQKVSFWTRVFYLPHQNKCDRNQQITFWYNWFLPTCRDYSNFLKLKNMKGSENDPIAFKTFVFSHLKFLVHIENEKHSSKTFHYNVMPSLWGGGLFSLTYSHVNFSLQIKLHDLSHFGNSKSDALVTSNFSEKITWQRSRLVIHCTHVLR